MIHFGTHTFDVESVCHIELQGDGSYLLEYSSRVSDKQIHVTGDNAEALREWLEQDRHMVDVGDELEEEHLKEHRK
jgi:hypothetical protein